MTFGTQLQAACETCASMTKPVKVDAVRGATVKGGISKPRLRTTPQLNPTTIIEFMTDNLETFEVIPSSKTAFVITCGSKDIDALNMDRQLATVDYVKDICKFYKSCEKSCQPQDYMDSQVEINANMRAILADWLIRVHAKSNLRPETLYLTVHIIDRYLSLEIVSPRELQLVGGAAMFIACKCEETKAPKVNDFVCLYEMPPLGMCKNHGDVSFICSRECAQHGLLQVLKP